MPLSRLSKLLRRWRWRQQINARCPKGGRHEWDILAHGPGGSAFDCMKCGKVWP